MRRIVETKGLRESIETQLSTFRRVGEPSLTEFLTQDLVPAAATIAEDFDGLPIHDEHHRRLTIGRPNTYIPFFHVFCRLDANMPDLVVMAHVDIGRWPIDDAGI